MWKSPHHHSHQPSADGSNSPPGGLVGQVLVASPSVSNPYFARTAILVLQHHAEGAAGVVLNRPAGHSIQQIWRHVSNTPCVHDQDFHVGGPLPGPMVALHREEKLGELRVGNDLYVAAERSLLDQIVSRETVPFRLFVGHAGWGRGQLERELRQGVWMLLPAGSVEIFTAETELWPTAVRQVGAGVLRTAIPERLISPDPSLN